MNYRAFLAASLVALAGCGGGGGGGAATSPGVVPPQPSTAPSSAPGATPTANLRLTFALPKSKSSIGVKPSYVSPNSTKIDVKVNSVNGGAPPSWVPADTVTALDFTPTTGNCTASGGTATCTIAVPAPPGTVNYTFSVEDGSSNVLATITVSETMTQGVTNSITVTLQGVVSTVTVSGASLAANDTSHATTGETLTVAAFDASGAQIVNGTTSANYSNPFTLTDNDASGQTKLSLNGGTAASSVVVSNPSDVVTLVYTGQAANGFTVSASGTGITGGGTIATTVNDVTFTGTTNDDAAHGGLSTDTNWGQQTLFFSSPSGSQTISGAELGFTNTPFSKLFDVTLAAGCSGIATVSAGPATTFTVTATGVGVCSGRLSEHGTGYPLTGHTANASGSPTHDGTFWISVTGSSFSVN